MRARRTLHLAGAECRASLTGRINTNGTKATTHIKSIESRCFTFILYLPKTNIGRGIGNSKFKITLAERIDSQKKRKPVWPAQKRGGKLIMKKIFICRF
jgi:hypothetical protein